MLCHILQMYFKQMNQQKNKDFELNEGMPWYEKRNTTQRNE